MPKVFLEVPDTEASTARPVTMEVIRQICAATGIDKNTNILYTTEEGEDAQLGSRIGDDGEKTKFPSTNRVFVDVEEDYIRDRIMTSAIHHPEHNFIFLDQALGVYIKPVYSSTEVTINFRYRARDKVAARRWRDDVMNRTSMMRDVLLHTATYHYLIPPEHIYILKEIHRLRENQAGYGEDFDKYFKDNSTQRLTLLTNLSGTQDAWAISETQQQVQGWFDFEGVPEAGSKENESDAWTISFSYKYRYDKALACLMMYPLMIHNQPISKKFRDNKSPYEVEDHQRSHSLSKGFFTHFEKNPRNPANPNISGVGIPEVDDFIPGQVLPKTMRVLTALVKLTTEDKRTLLDFKSLGKYKLDEVFMDFFETEAPYVTKPYESIIQVHLYRNTNISPDRFVRVNNQTVVSVTEDLNLRDFHHIRLSLVTDLTLLSNAAIERLRNNGCAFRTIMAAIFPQLMTDGLLPESMCKLNYVTRDQWDRVVSVMERGIYAKGNKEPYQFNTVMNLYVKTALLDKQ